MAVRSKVEDGKLTLEIDNGDFEKLESCMREWSFKDHQSFVRFAISIMLITEDKTLGLKTQGKLEPVTPAPQYLKTPGV